MLSNVYLDPLDRLMAEADFEMVRYADDFVILCRSNEEAEAALALVRDWTTEAGLTLHPTKTKVVDAFAEGFEFLGYRFEHGDRFPREKSLKKLKETLRTKTRRANGRSLNRIVADVNVTLGGWFEYFKHATKRYMFADLDRWLRMRFRSILRKRSGRRGKARRGKDGQRWPNTFFVELGLFHLEIAHKTACQSSSR